MIKKLSKNRFIEKIPYVSIIIPCRNEENYIIKSLSSLLKNNYPLDKIEILVIDGMSTDKTPILVKQFIKAHKKIKLLKNPHMTVPFALNKGIKEAKGEVIIRADAHSIYPQNYISELVKILIKEGADNVGGMFDIKPGADTFEAKIVSYSVKSFFGIGGVSYRNYSGNKIIKVDTVPFGCYRKEIFKKIGMFDTEFIRNQDDEFNLRLTKNGGKIILVPWVKIKYFMRPTFMQTFKMYFQYGYWKIKVIKKHHIPASIRHIIPLIFIFFIFSFPIALFYKFYLSIYIIVMSIYFLFLLTGGIIESLKNRLRFKGIFPMAFAFFLLHFSYGCGLAKGIIDFLILNRRFRDFSLTR